MDLYKSSEITVHKLNELREENKKIQILDVREDTEREHAHIKGTIHIKLSEIANRYTELDIDKNIKLIADDFFVYLNFKLWNTFLNKLDAFTCSIAFIVGIEKMASTSSPTKKILVKFKNENLGSIFRPIFSLK